MVVAWDGSDHAQVLNHFIGFWTEEMFCTLTNGDDKLLHLNCTNVVF